MGAKESYDGNGNVAKQKIYRAGQWLWTCVFLYPPLQNDNAKQQSCTCFGERGPQWLFFCVCVPFELNAVITYLA